MIKDWQRPMIFNVCIFNVPVQQYSGSAYLAEKLLITSWYNNTLITTVLIANGFIIEHIEIN